MKTKILIMVLILVLLSTNLILAEGMSLSRDEKIKEQKNIALEYMIEKEREETKRQINRFWFGIGTLILFNIFLK